MYKLRVFCCLLLASLCGASQLANIEKLSWKQPELPNLLPVAELVQGRAEFKGRVPQGLHVECDLECELAKGDLPVTLQEIENQMSYETLDVEQEIRVKTLVNVTDIPSDLFRHSSIVQEQSNVEKSNASIVRRRRAVFGYDTRYNLNVKRFANIFPFSAVVRLSNGCGGVLIGPKHVLTTAHCIHDGKRYLKGVKRLRVGRYVNKKLRKGKKNKRKKNKNKKSKKVRSRRSAPSKTVQKFRWTRAKKTHIPQAWLQRRGQASTQLKVEFDYAVLELKRALGKDFMKLGLSPPKSDLPRSGRIHFTAFDGNKKPQMRYRYCQVEEQTGDMIYNYCDAERGTSGAGIYIRMFDRNTTTWDRRVIGVFSGHQWVEGAKGTPPKEYNTGVRITPLKYAQICFWAKGDYSQCRSG